MTFLYLLPVGLSLLLLAAHAYFRFASIALVGLCFAAIMLVAVRRRWVPGVIRIVLLVGALEWLRTIVMLIDERQQQDRPWIRMAVILGSVLVVTAASGLVFALPRVRRRYCN